MTFFMSSSFIYFTSYFPFILDIIVYGTKERRQFYIKIRSSTFPLYHVRISNTLCYLIYFTFATVSVGAVNDVAFPEGCPDLIVTSSKGENDMVLL